MNQQNHGKSMSSMKRRCCRPFMHESEALQQKMSVRSRSSGLMNFSQGTVKTEDCDNLTLGTKVNGVITGTFDNGYLVEVQIPGTDIPLSGCVFTTERLAPATEENGVAPQVSTIKQEDIPIPPFELKPSMDSFVPKQSTVQIKSETFTFEDQVLPTGLASGISASLGNQCTSGLPMTDLPINKAINLVSVIKNSDEEVTKGQQAVSSVDMKKEFSHDQLKNPKIEIVEPEPMPFEQISKGSNFLEKNDSSVAGVADVNANQRNESFVDSQI